MIQRTITTPELAPNQRCIRLPVLMEAAIVQLAAENRMTISDCMREILARGLDAVKK